MAGKPADGDAEGAGVYPCWVVVGTFEQDRSGFGFLPDLRPD